jgi:hypothetical protein
MKYRQMWKREVSVEKPEIVSILAAIKTTLPTKKRRRQLETSGPSRLSQKP